MIKEIIRAIIFLIGIYEWVSIISIFRNDINTTKSDFLLLDADFIAQEKPALYLLVIFVFFLGLNRLTWTLSLTLFPKDNHIYLWWNVVLLHAAESIMFLTLAMKPYFNTTQEPNLIGLYRKVLTLELGNNHSRDVLVIAPLLLLLVIVHGAKA